MKVVLACGLLPATGLVHAQEGQVLHRALDLGEEIAHFRAGAQTFVSSWNATGAACAEASRVPFGNLRRPCRRVRVALRNGEFLLFASECAALGSRHNGLVEEYRKVAAQPPAGRVAIETALLDNEQNLISTCSPSTWRTDYPAFARLRSEAGDPRYRTSANRFHASNPDYRLLATLENTLVASEAGAQRATPVTGAGSFVGGGSD